MDKLLNSIKTRLKYLTNNTENAFIISSCNSIDMRLDQIRNKTIISQQSLDMLCEYINKDIDKMRRVITEETSMEYRKMDELSNFIEQLREEYFK